MATYHTPHTFTPGMQSQVWDRAIRRKVWRPNPNFCAVCGRKAVHILHPTPNSSTRTELPDGTVETHEYDELGRLCVFTRE
jgi:hypothetical protein